MKTKYFILAAIAAVGLASCADDVFVGDNSPNVVEGTSVNDGAILFSGGTTALTRADLYGLAAATKLGSKFVVYGTKHGANAENETATNDDVVFGNFQVAYTASTAGTTESNSSDWEYVGLQAYNETPTSQGIKYWDYSADNGYTFYAFSSPDISYKASSSDLVSVTKVTADGAATGASLYNKGYRVTVKNGADLNNLYFSDRKEVAKENYGKTVDLTFRNIGSKVRVGFYETIPGYDVKIDKFYIDEDAEAAVTTFSAMKDAKTDGFHASLQNVKTNVDQILNVTYYNSGTVINRPKMTQPNAGFYFDLTLGAGVIGTTLSDNAAQPTWDTPIHSDPSDLTSAITGGDYTPVFPFEDNTNPLLLKLDFTMTANDGSGDVIHVRGARAIVPVEYVKWKSNFVYTYIFKISDKSNGTTGDVDANGDPIDDPEGLKPITFDAIVVDVDDNYQQTITSVSTNSITTYAEGQIVNEYTAGKPIYVAITDNSASAHSVITPSGIGTAAGNAQVYSLDKATTEATVLGELTGLPMDITMTALSSGVSVETTVPLADGTTPLINNVKFTPSSAGYYAYVYTTTPYEKPTYTAATAGAYASGTTYYMKSANNVYFAVSVPSPAAYDANVSSLYVQTAPGTPGVYDVKIIKVQ